MTRPADDARFKERESMVVAQIVARGVSDSLTLDAMRAVPRHQFVLEPFQTAAYRDHPVPIGHGQTISQPYIVVFMTAALGLTGEETVLEVGAGCGYQSVVLSFVSRRVFAIEIVELLAAETKERLASLGYSNV